MDRRRRFPGLVLISTSFTQGLVLVSRTVSVDLRQEMMMGVDLIGQSRARIGIHHAE
jgi:hypothetical protein